MTVDLDIVRKFFLSKALLGADALKSLPKVPKVRPMG